MVLFLAYMSGCSARPKDLQESSRSYMYRYAGGMWVGLDDLVSFMGWYDEPVRTHP